MRRAASCARAICARLWARPWLERAVPTETTTLPSAAPAIVPTAPNVDKSTAEQTAASAPPAILAQSIWRRDPISVRSSSPAPVF